jgi:ElaB/YqjD/DUF883 family membrane-anchored ribosome-binding protein
VARKAANTHRQDVEDAMKRDHELAEELVQEHSLESVCTVKEREHCRRKRARAMVALGTGVGPMTEGLEFTLDRLNCLDSLKAELPSLLEEGSPGSHEKVRHILQRANVRLCASKRQSTRHGDDDLTESRYCYLERLLTTHLPPLYSVRPAVEDAALQPSWIVRSLRSMKPLLTPK